MLYFGKVFAIKVPKVSLSAKYRGYELEPIYPTDDTHDLSMSTSQMSV
jgi:hypothetical protein